VKKPLVFFSGKIQSISAFKNVIIIIVKVDLIFDTTPELKMSSRAPTVYDRTVRATELVNVVIEYCKH
jgi:hypothetical protein